MEYHVFISHSSKDKNTADAICHALEDSGIRCWIAPRDIKPGKTWASEIMHGIKNARLIVLVFSHYANVSEHVTNEINVAFTHNKIIIPFMIENVPMNEDFAYYLNRKHWLAAYPDYKNKFAELIQSVKHNLGTDFVPQQKQQEAADMPVATVEKPEKKHSTRKFPVAAVLITFALFVGAFLFTLFLLQDRAKPVENNEQIATETPMETPTNQPADSVETKEIKVIEKVKTQQVTEKTAVEQKVTEKPKTTTTAPSVETKKTNEPAVQGTLTIAGNTYEGSVRGGKPDGSGILYFKSLTIISRKDPEKTMAAEGDYIVGRWHEGELEMGTLYDSNHEKKQVIRIGR